MRLSSKPQEEEVMKEYFKQLKEYFIKSTDRDYIYDDEECSLYVGNNILSAPVKIFGMTIPEGKRYYIFDFHIRIKNEGEMNAEITVSFLMLTILLLITSGIFAFVSMDRVLASIPIYLENFTLFFVLYGMAFSVISFISIIRLKSAIKGLFYEAK